MSHRIEGNTLHIFNERGTMSMDRADAAAIVTLGVAGSGVDQNLDLIFKTIQGMKAEIGELQLQVQKLETGSRDDEQEGPGPSERAFAAKHEEAPKPLPRRRVTMHPALAAPYGSEQKPGDMAGFQPLVCRKVWVEWRRGRWEPSEDAPSNTDAALIDKLNTAGDDGWCSLAWPNRIYVAVVAGELCYKVGDRSGIAGTDDNPFYIPSIQRFLLTPAAKGCKLAIDWHHATAPAQIPRNAAEVQATTAAVRKAAPKRTLADAIDDYLSIQVRELSDRAAESYKKEGKSSRTMQLDDEAEIVTRILADVRRIVNKT
jgi:hypothetical protein